MTRTLLMRLTTLFTYPTNVVTNVLLVLIKKKYKHWDCGDEMRLTQKNQGGGLIWVEEM